MDGDGVRYRPTNIPSYNLDMRSERAETMTVLSHKRCIALIYRCVSSMVVTIIAHITYRTVLIARPFRWLLLPLINRVRSHRIPHIIFS
jgi:hypothetical protein